MTKGIVGSAALISAVVFALGLMATGVRAAEAPKAGEGLTAEVKVGKDIKDREVVDAGQEFPVDVGSLVAWSKVAGAPAGAQTAIKHVWYRDDKQVAEVELSIGGSPWRTWSRKKVAPGMTGSWKVEVHGPDGATIGSATFAVK